MKASVCNVNVPVLSNLGHWGYLDIFRKNDKGCTLDASLPKCRTRSAFKVKMLNVNLLYQVTLVLSSLRSLHTSDEFHIFPPGVLLEISHKLFQAYSVVVQSDPLNSSLKYAEILQRTNRGD